MASALRTLYLLLSCIAITAALVSSNDGKAVTFSIPQIRTNAPPRSIAADKQKMASRYGHLSATIDKRHSRRKCGHAPAYPLPHESSYVCPVHIGGQLVYLDFDTGSSDLWVMSSSLPENQTANHHTYNPALSDSSKLLEGNTWNVTYGDNTSSSGVVYLDTVNVGGAVASSQAVQVATTLSKTWTGSRDGILGLAADSLNTVKPQKQKTFFTNIASSLPSKIFTAYLRKGQAGSFDFGFIGHGKYTGSISYLPVNPASGLWQFAAGGYAIGNDDGPMSDPVGTAFIDSGSSLTYLPKPLITSYYQQVQNATYSKSHDGYIFPCTASLPNLTFQLGHGRIVMPGHLVNYAPVRKGAEICLGGIQESPAPGISIFGDTFFKASFVVFDRNDESAPRVGFAQQH